MSDDDLIPLDDQQQFRHAWRLISEMLSIAHQEMIKKGMPGPVVEAVLISQYHGIWGNNNVDQLTQLMREARKMLEGEDEDE